MIDRNKIMAERIEALAQRIRKGEFKVEDISISQPAIDDFWEQEGQVTKKLGPDIYWTIHLIQKTR